MLPRLASTLLFFFFFFSFLRLFEAYVTIPGYKLIPLESKT